jgi:hypothetical protein
MVKIGKAEVTIMTTPAESSPGGSFFVEAATFDRLHEGPDGPRAAISSGWAVSMDEE